MQRFLVFLVLSLLLAVAVLGFFLSSLSGEIDSDRIARDREKLANRGGAATREDDPAKLRRIESKLKLARKENDRLRREVSNVKSRLDDLARVVARMSVTRPPRAVPAGDSENAGEMGPSGSGFSDRQRDENGNFRVSDDELEYFRAVQGKIDRQRRIDGQSRNYMRRIKALGTRREISDISDKNTIAVEKVLRRFVTLNDDLVSAYIRTPSDAMKQLSDESRSEQLRVSREKFGNEARTALESILGEVDSSKIAATVFTNPWGIRRGSRNR